MPSNTQSSVNSRIVSSSDSFAIETSENCDRKFIHLFFSRLVHHFLYCLPFLMTNITKTVIQLFSNKINSLDKKSKCNIKVDFCLQQNLVNFENQRDKLVGARVRVLWTEAPCTKGVIGLVVKKRITQD